MSPQNIDPNARYADPRHLIAFFQTVAMACAIMVDARDIPNTRENSILLYDALEAYEAWAKAHKEESTPGEQAE